MDSVEIYWTVMISLIFITIWFVWYGIAASNSMMKNNSPKKARVIFPAGSPHAGKTGILNPVTGNYKVQQ